MRNDRRFPSRALVPILSEFERVVAALPADGYSVGETGATKLSAPSTARLTYPIEQMVNGPPAGYVDREAGGTEVVTTAAARLTALTKPWQADVISALGADDFPTSPRGCPSHPPRPVMGRFVWEGAGSTESALGSRIQIGNKDLETGESFSPYSSSDRLTSHALMLPRGSVHADDRAGAIATDSNPDRARFADSSADLLNCLNDAQSEAGRPLVVLGAALRDWR